MSKPLYLHAPPPSNGHAIAGFVLSIIGFFFGPLLLPALIFCIVGARREPRTLATAGMIICLIGFTTWVVLSVLTFTLFAAPILLCAGISSAAQDDLEEKLIDDFGNHPAVVREIGEIESVQFSWSDTIETLDTEDQTTSVIYKVDGTLGSGRIIVTRHEREGGRETARLITENGEFDISQFTSQPPPPQPLDRPPRP